MQQHAAPEAGRADALVRAIRSGKADAVRRIIQSGPSVNARVGVNHWTPLLHAIHKDQPAILAILLEAGADPNLDGHGGMTPLIMAAGYGDIASVRLLLARGADTNRQTASGDTALSAALTGSTDLDNFTLGHCHRETVRAILEANPQAKAELSRSTVWLARLGGCNDVINRIATR